MKEKKKKKLSIGRKLRIASICSVDNFIFYCLIYIQTVGRHSLSDMNQGIGCCERCEINGLKQSLAVLLKLISYPRDKTELRLLLCLLLYFTYINIRVMSSLSVQYFWEHRRKVAVRAFV